MEQKAKLQKVSPREKQVTETNDQRYKLNAYAARNIRRLYSSGMVSLDSLAKQYNVCSSSIRQIIFNQSYYDPTYKTPEIKKNNPLKYV